MKAFKTVISACLALIISFPFYYTSAEPAGNKADPKAGSEERIVWDELSDLADSINNTDTRDWIYKLMIDGLWEEKEKKVLKEGKEVQDKQKVFRFREMEKLKMLKKAVIAAEKIQDEITRFKYLLKLSEELSGTDIITAKDVFSKTISAAALIPDSSFYNGNVYSACNAFEETAIVLCRTDYTQFRDELKQLISVIVNIHCTYNKAALYHSIAGLLVLKDRETAADLCLKAAGETLLLRNVSERAEKLSEIAKSLATINPVKAREVFLNAVNEAEKIRNNSRYYTLIRIAKNIGLSDTKKAEEIFRQLISEADKENEDMYKANSLGETAKALTEINFKVSNDIFIKLISAADKISKEYKTDLFHAGHTKISVFTETAKGLAPYDLKTSKEIFLKAVAMAEKISNASQYSVFAGIAKDIAPTDPDTSKAIFRKAITSAERLNVDDKSYAIKLLANTVVNTDLNMSGDLFMELISSAEKIKDDLRKSGVILEITKAQAKVKPAPDMKVLMRLISSTENILNITDKSDVFKETLKILSIPDLAEREKICMHIVSSAEKIQNEMLKAGILKDTARVLASIDKKKAAGIFMMAVTASEKIKEDADKSRYLAGIAKDLAGFDTMKAREVFDRSVSIAEKIQGAAYYDIILAELSGAVHAAGSGMEDVFYERIISAADRIGDNYIKSIALRKIAEVLFQRKPEKSSELLRRFILAAEKNDDQTKYHSFTGLAQSLADMKSGKLADIFHLLISAADKIQDNNQRSDIIFKITGALAGADVKEFHEVYLKLIKCAEKMENDHDRADILGEIFLSIGTADIHEALLLYNVIFNALKTTNYNRHIISGTALNDEDENNIRFIFSFKLRKRFGSRYVIDSPSGLLLFFVRCLCPYIDQPAVKYREYLKAVKKTVMAYNSVLRRGPLEPPLVMNVIAGNNILYPSLTFGYGTENLALMRAEFFNPSDKNIKFRLTAKQGEYLDSGKFIYPGVYELKPEEKLIVELPLLLNHAFVLRNKFTKTGFGLTLTAQDAGETGSSQNPAVLASTETEFSVQTANTMEWGSEKKAMQFASFMTVPKEMKDFVKDKMNKIHIEGEEYIFPPLRRAMKIYSILAAMEFNYAPVGIKDDNTDDVYYPVETFMTRSGNCSSLTAMFCALLEDNLVETAYYVTDRHVFTLINTGVRVEGDSVNKLNRYMLSPDTGDLKIIEGSEFYWIPFETTALGYNTKLKRQYSFLEGWKYGVESFQKKPEAIIMTRQAWGSGYRKMLYEITKWREPRWKDSETKEALNLYSNEIKTFRKQKYENALSELRKSAETKRSPGSYIDLGMFYGLNGEYGKAIQWIKKGIELKPTGSGYNGLGNIYMITGKYRESLKQYSAGLEIEGVSVDEKAKLLINLALLYDRKKEALDPNGDELRKVLKRIDSLPEFVREQYRALYDSFMKSVSSRASEVDEDMRNSVLW
jgi:tetratricopeptide (TPR) repeat protein